jgi:hypothetical protein
MSDWTYISAAYAVTWVMLIGYGVYLAARRRAVARAERERRELDIPCRELDMPYGGGR